MQKSALVPRLLIQLCIENAIKHGISQLREGGKIKLEVNVEQEALYLLLANPCPGQEPARKKSKHTGIGLKNIGERLKLLYGEKRSFVQFNKKTEDGASMAEVVICLPYEEAH